ncbi:cyclopropane-fatty-acyl-phospholipid synthase [Jatrophihabitans sp. GAS493]|nr:cyclopropane-fatty-acyl-phospholipid synthase family protein [Jatrophihabitans sp. GAS493]SOD74054.1 cyclopropane-fatty-acyl-phospholipid synthase [Jatrophihabitans sp. GAS493]
MTEMNLRPAGNDLAARQPEVCGPLDTVGTELTVSSSGSPAGARLLADRIDPQLWPDVATVPHARLRAAVARRLFVHAVNRLPLRVVEASGRAYGGGGSRDPLMTLIRPDAFFSRVGATGTIGFGEAFMAGDWSAEDPAEVLSAFAANMGKLIPSSLQKLRGAVLRKQPIADDNTLEGSRKNIERHYDLSNDLFKEFLDQSMTYSSALFNGDPRESDDDLLTAQHRKIDRLLDSAKVGPGTRVLEIGTGWGELALRAAGRGAHVTSITISTEQAALARARIAEAGLSHLAEVRLQDYRQTCGAFDAVVSVEMIEAVGANHWNEYFGTVDRLLAPGGRFALQAIVQVDDRMRASSETYTWTRKYIFPGGQLPSAESIGATVAKVTSLRVTDRFAFGQHYAETLRRWREQFESRAHAVTHLGFDDTFRRMWSLYLAYSEAGFRTGYLDVHQITLTKPQLV